MACNRVFSHCIAFCYFTHFVWQKLTLFRIWEITFGPHCYILAFTTTNRSSKALKSSLIPLHNRPSVDCHGRLRSNVTINGFLRVNIGCWLTVTTVCGVGVVGLLRKLLLLKRSIRSLDGAKCPHYISVTVATTGFQTPVENWHSTKWKSAVFVNRIWTKM